MQKNKSISSRNVDNITIYLTIILLVLSVLFHSSRVYFYVFIMLFLLPFMFYLYKKLGKINVIQFILYLTTIFTVLIFTFRKVRNMFYVPLIGDQEIIGYSQYYGYPFYFDTLLFLILILLPVLFLIIKKYMSK